VINQISLLDKINKFKKYLFDQPFILLARPNKEVYKDELARKKFENKLNQLINIGLLNIEIPWQDNENWLDIMSGLKSKFPHIQLGSASILNKKSIDDSLKLGLDFSMMQFWQKDLYIYTQKKNYLLIPGLKFLQDFKEATSINCQIVKIFPVEDKEKILDIKKNNKIFFIGAGGVSFNDLYRFNSLGYKGIVIGKKGFDGELFDPNIYKWLKDNSK